ncbi:metallophosphoesterase [Staphylococcus xylosus]|uniref:YfcE family phosphodiesterase n=1 Tax=Staphylococcus TaxID=1279 RepID=UPI000734DD61|nr:metallophosphoesterase [Staphylococcus xylosus]ARD74148.1 phosphoesterase [Staphylococcus xylosus]KTW23377.1 phosphoesterase [Staphylococcus xylosus]MBF0811421.1 metallophosphoesterase [Staphylococcus xylosus]MBV5140374.1 metallophosphoesterase [Staphylococcus xylosus]MBW3126646.1 metallophosphoesterase [Staphylococcus xylosus]
MLKWIIISDNHTEQGILFDVISHHDNVDVAIHLGDSEFEYHDSELSHFYRVKGNTDFYPEFPNEEIIEVNDIRAFYTHGHLYNVNLTRMQLAEQAKASGCQFAFYGHTHVAKHEHISDVHVINPGSISQSRSNIEETYAELLIDETEKDVKLNFYNRNHQIIDSETFSL